jgi:hypothetical protein
MLLMTRKKGQVIPTVRSQAGIAPAIAAARKILYKQCGISTSLLLDAEILIYYDNIIARELDEVKSLCEQKAACRYVLQPSNYKFDNRRLGLYTQYFTHVDYNRKHRSLRNCRRRLYNEGFDASLLHDGEVCAIKHCKTMDRLDYLNMLEYLCR